MLLIVYDINWIYIIQFLTFISECALHRYEELGKIPKKKTKNKATPFYHALSEIRFQAPKTRYSEYFSNKFPFSLSLNKGSSW